jgi:uncharacterized protein with ParB-like and HNH nuclease domain
MARDGQQSITLIVMVVVVITIVLIKYNVKDVVELARRRDE